MEKYRQCMGRMQYHDQLLWNAASNSKTVADLTNAERQRSPTTVVTSDMVQTWTLICSATFLQMSAATGSYVRK